MAIVRALMLFFGYFSFAATASGFVLAGNNESTSQEDSCLFQLHAIRGGTGADESTSSNEAEQLRAVEDDDHALSVVDHGDYRADAAAFLQEAESKAVSALQEKEAYAEKVHKRCGLQSLKLAEVEALWQSHLEKITRTFVKQSLDEQLRRARKTFPEELAGGQPVLVGPSVDKELGWPANLKWEQTQLMDRLDNVSMEPYAFMYPQWVQTVQNASTSLQRGDPVLQGIPGRETVRKYLDSGQSGKGIFLFVNERPGRSSKKAMQHHILDILRDDFSPTPAFAMPSRQNKAILAIDGIGSSHGFHSHEPVWQVQVKGHKLWYLLPPEVPVTNRNDDGSPSHGSAPLISGRPFEHANACAFLKRVHVPAEVQHCLLAPGEMLILPGDYLHATCALDNYTAAVGGWLGV